MTCVAGLPTRSLSVMSSSSVSSIAFYQDLAAGFPQFDPVRARNKQGEIERKAVSLPFLNSVPLTSASTG
jgi:hypothetical protein